VSEASKDNRIKPVQLERTVVIGNTASGKSWLSRRLGDKLSSVVVDLDQIRWVDGDYSRKEGVQTAVAKTVEKAKMEQWVIEGVYGWLVAPILERAICLIWTDLTWIESSKNLLSRETALGPAGNFDELEAWSRDYWTRNSASSYAAHLAIFESFKHPKFRLLNRTEISRFIGKIDKN
jgi:adenylate kinase family enzyme